MINLCTPEYEKWALLCIQINSRFWRKTVISKNFYSQLCKNIMFNVSPLIRFGCNEDFIWKMQAHARCRLCVVHKSIHERIIASIEWCNYIIFLISSNSYIHRRFIITFYSIVNCFYTTSIFIKTDKISSRRVNSVGKYFIIELIFKIL